MATTKRLSTDAAKKPKTGGRVAKTMQQKLAEGSARSVIAGWNDDTTVDSEIAALYLGISEKKLAELRGSTKQASVDGEAAGPPLIKYFDKGASGQNQPVLYKLRDLRDYQKKNKASDSFNAALNAGLAGWTTMRQPFFAELEKRRQPLVLEASAWDMRAPNREGRFASLIEGRTRVVWLTASEAARSRWSSLQAHSEFAAAGLLALSQEREAIGAAIDGTDIALLSLQTALIGPLNLGQL